MHLTTFTIYQIVWLITEMDIDREKWQHSFNKLYI